jgi:uncharacterized coiled-coil protein SlyX
MEDKMLGTYREFDYNSKMQELNAVRISALEERLSKSKSTIDKLKNAMATIKNNDKLKRKFEERIVKESDYALEILFQIKDVRKKAQRKMAS